MIIKPFSAVGIALTGLLLSRSILADQVAGAVHILVDGGGNTLSALVAGAIGKSDATAAANTDGAGHIDVYAAGVGGTLTPSGGYLDNVTQDATRGTATGSLQAGAVVDFDATAATFSFDPDSNFTGNIVTDSSTTVHP